MKCFIDMDGVIVDMVPPWLRIRGFQMPQPWPDGEYDLSKIFGISHHDLWHGCDEEWWANLPKTPDADTIIKMVEQRFAAEDIYIVTRPVVNAGATGKLLWLNKHYPRFLNHYLMTPCRQILAADDAVLIDDQSDNTDRFNKSGGRGITLARVWNNRYAKSNQTVADLEMRLSRCLHAFGVGAYEITGQEWA